MTGPNEMTILQLIFAIIFSLAFVIGGIIFIKRYRNYTKIIGKCTKTEYMIKHRASTIEYEYNGEKYSTRKHIPFSEEGCEEKLRIDPNNPKKTMSWYDAFLSWECVFLGLLLIVVTIIDFF